MALLFDSWLMELGAVVITLLAGIYLYFTHTYRFWKNKGIPYVEPSFPFGNLADLFLQRKTASETFRSWYWKLEGHKFGGIYQLNSPALLIRDPELIKCVLTKDFAHFHDHGVYMDEKNDPISGNLFMLEGTRWRHLRYKMTPTFTSGKMKMMFPTIVECGKELKAYLAPIAKRQETIEVKDILAKFGTDIIASCAFGIESNCIKNPDSEFRRMGKKIFEPSLYMLVRDMLLFLVPKVGALFKIPFTPRDISKFFTGVVKETIEFREKNNVSRNDFMQLLIALKNKKPIIEEKEGDVIEEKTKEKNMYDINGMTLDEVTAQAFVFFMGGFETSSIVVSFCLYEMALNQEMQNRVRAEVDSVIAEHGGQLTYEGMQKMEYTDRVVQEALRKYPPAPILTRKCNKDFKVPDSEITIECGTPLLIPNHALQMDPQYFPNPEEFNPDRFTEEAKSQRHHYVYLPFGEGPRNCIGSRFALMQTKIGIASFISSYQVNIDKKLTPVPIVLDKKSMMVNAKGGIHLQISERST